MKKFLLKELTELRLIRIFRKGTLEKVRSNQVLVYLRFLYSKTASTILIIGIPYMVMKFNISIKLI